MVRRVNVAIQTVIGKVLIDHRCLRLDQILALLQEVNHAFLAAALVGVEVIVEEVGRD
jgi:hypothetical protein